MESAASVAPIDLVAAAILGIAGLRGLFRGLIRETFSFGSLAAAYVAVRMFRIPVGQWLFVNSQGAISEGAAPWVAAGLLVVAAIAAVTIASRLVRVGARVAGLRWADRAGGAALGVAEGAIAAGALVLIAGAILGRGHPLLAESRSLAALERLEQAAGTTVSADVAAPPPG